jgi:DNA repair ATPase RecN
VLSAPLVTTPNIIMDMASLADLEARVAALEADRADYRAVLAAVGALAGRISDAEVKIDAHREAINALGEKVAGFQAELRERIDTLDRNREEDRGEAAAFRRSVEDGQAELKSLILQALDRPSDQ